MPESSELNANSTIALIGGGQAASEAASLLRQFGFPGRIVLYGDEAYLPYMRPPLSKAFLSGDINIDALIYKPLTAYEEAKIETHAGARVTEIDRHAKAFLLENGERCSYDRLIIATGGSARRLPAPGTELNNIFYLRTIADVLALQSQLKPGRRLVIVGAGYVGLEVAAVAIKRGLRVTVIEAAPRVLARVAAPGLSSFYERVHRAAGVDIRTGVAVSGFKAKRDGVSVGAVECGEDPDIPADFVVIGIGLIPNTELAEKAGLIVDDGIVVDELCRTNDPDIYAIGDCAVHARHGFLERKTRLESVPNALAQARVAASDLCGKPIPQANAPWFWSDQYDLKLQMVGFSEGYEQVVLRGSLETSSFVAFYFAEGHVVAADAVNRPGDFMVAKRLVGERRTIAPEKLADEATLLKSLL